MVFKTLKFSAACFFTLGVLWGVGWLWFAAAVASVKEAPATDTLGKAGAIVVLTGGDGRIAAGFDLLIAGRADKLFVSGVAEGVRIDNLLALWHANGGRELVPCCITLGYKARDTEGNARETQEWIRSNSVSSIILVTSHYHMARSALEIEYALPEITVTRYPVVQPDIQAWKGRFWSLTFQEYNKFLLAWLRWNMLEAEKRRETVL